MDGRGRLVNAGDGMAPNKLGAEMVAAAPTKSWLMLAWKAAFGSAFSSGKADGLPNATSLTLPKGTSLALRVVKGTVPCDGAKVLDHSC